MGWVRRVWGELEAAVGWLHGEGVVHRDVKLESQTLLPKSSFPPLPVPLINLADFGLAKRLPPPPEPATLTTRCGSDSFACPEIIMGKEYDGRKADSWACGVVLFAM
ncbi:kinase-like domain-containing protein, partial [Mrakia frigida]|uniref:kinase-like domain-containing protein n=1 Tax=Mrakia frigida TaxID=29902 RepID=UPI003FCBF3C7